MSDSSIPQAHPAANLFPLLNEADTRALADDIAANGLLNPIVMHDGLVLDGRNRLAACQLAGVSAQFTPWIDPGCGPTAWVISQNLHRRHLNESQRAMIADSLATLQRGGDRRTDEFKASIDALKQDEAAALLKVGRAQVQRARKVREMAAPETVAAIEAGEQTITGALRDIQKAANKAAREEVASRDPGPVPTDCHVLVIDPPWPIEKIDRDVRPNQVGFDYPTMTIAEMKDTNEGLGRRVLDAAANDCHLFVWTTTKFLPETFTILKAWDFRYVFTMVWHKPGGFQPIGLPQYNAEFVVYGRRGAPEFVDTKAFNLVFDAPRGAHSEKPEAFYDLLRRVTDGRRGDMFNRRQIDGFIGWGNEA